MKKAAKKKPAPRQAPRTGRTRSRHKRISRSSPVKSQADYLPLPTPEETAASKARFLEAFAVEGLITVAAKVAGINPRTHYGWTKTDVEYAKSFQEALETAVDAAEQELRRRGIKGVEKPLSYQGELTGHTIREYSDACLIFYLKGRRRDVFADRLLGAGADGSHLVRLEDVLEHVAKLREGEDPNTIDVTPQRPALASGKPDPFSR